MPVLLQDALKSITSMDVERPSPNTVLTDLGHAGRWLSSQDLDAEQLDEEQIAAFLAARFEVTGRRAKFPTIATGTPS